jgi:PIN domain nuclease of toxin-antitoxin system
VKRLLLDSHVLIWWADGGERISAAANEAISDPRNFVFVSAASIWELGLKRSLVVLTTPDDYNSLIRDNRFGSLPVTIQHAITMHELPPIHKDPFDRLLVAQAKYEGFTLVTRDAVLSGYDIPILTA